MRFLRFVLLLGLGSAVGLAAEKNSIVGQVQPEIRLTDGTVLTKAKIIGYSVEKDHATATLAESTHVRVVALDALPPKLRDQILTEAGVKPETPEKKSRRARPVQVPPSPPPPDKTILPDAPVSTANSPTAPATALDSLLKQAGTAAPDELKFYLTKTFDRVGSLTCKVREVAQVPGWQKIRVSGEAAFTQWDARQADHVWRTDKFEVEFAIVDGRTLKPESVSFAGIARRVGER